MSGMRIPPIFIVCLLWTIAQPTRAENSSGETISPRIHALVKAAVAKSGIPGYSIAVIDKGKIIHQAGYGFADAAKQKPVTPRTVFGLASITKTFTAMALLSLVEQGKIGLDDTLDKHLTVLPPSWRKITIRQLASMTSGIPTGIPNEVAWPAEMVILQRKPLMFKPGTRYCYSNPGYRTLGTVIEKASGKPYLQYVNETILVPLKMGHTGPREQFDQKDISAALGVSKAGARPVTFAYKPTDISFSSGMLFSNTQDMSKYAQGILDQKILSADSYQTLLHDRPSLPGGTPAKWAFGWGSTHKQAYGGKLVCGMNGGNPGVSSTIIIIPDEKIAIIGLSNAYCADAYKIPRMVARSLLLKDSSIVHDSAELQELAF